ncbi:zinc finger CCCH domain-containing protein 11A isoform X2 [Lampris incognitus]|uniref:zinc finger CCCH domain-containing protein 11A isoform X2 n=1 Tax=Lampris incognitus TaxID=2546036 RepID=UPI0024B589D6|nr:zinc finger CCCH domain-containing protein 11A isoform X2 [Lampris incognitus]
MSKHGVDCYFYYYSTCAKGDSCPFRHCEAAMGNETVCSLWQEGRCHRTVCKFRHMEIKKNRKEIPCYWENQPAGCQKPHCVFYHEKPRYIDGIYVPPSKGITKHEDTPHEEPAPPLTTPHPAATNPQLRGVIKAETQETVPSPTHPPVVINPADDDEDEDDQFSEEGEDGKMGLDGARLTSPRKVTGSPKRDDSLNFGVSTLEEIRLRKALKASMKRAGYPVQSSDAPLLKNNKANREKENIGSFPQPVISQARDDVQTGCDPQLRRSLAERLGGILDEEDSRVTPQKALKPVRDRLGLSTESVAPTQSAPSIPDTVEEIKKAPEHLHIKTLEEIRQEKAAKTEKQKDSSSVPAPVSTTTETVTSKPTKGAKRTITVKTTSISQVKTFSEILHEKKKQQQDQQIANKNPGKDQNPADATVPSRVIPPETEVRVKTLEEILREKAARSQALQPQETNDVKSSVSEDMLSKKPRLLRVNKAASVVSITTQKTEDVTDMPVDTPTCAEDSPASNNGIKVKTFEEIMREKRLRKQEMEEQASSTSQSQVSAELEPSLKQPASSALRRKVPVRARVSPPAISPASDVTTLTQETPADKQISLKPKAVSPLHNTANTITASYTTSTQKQASLLQQTEVQTPSQSRISSIVSPGKRKRSSPNTPAKQTKIIAPSSSEEEHPADKTQNNSLKKCPGQTTEPKVRPRLNVKPSVIKPAMQVKPGQKTKTEERSAVAAVKPLNSASTVLDEPLQKMPCGQSGISSSVEDQLILTVPSSPTASTLTEELQTVPVFQQSPVQTLPAITTTPAAARETSIIPQSPILKTPTQGKSRRPSLATSRGPFSTCSATSSASAVDDFDELMNEFTDDHLEEDVDPGMGEDDLLQELSEMIDS